MKISIILPIYNEVEIIEKSLMKTEEFIKSTNYDYEIILAEDGSKDGSDKICEKLASRKKRIKHFHSDNRLGRGRALKKVLVKTTGDVLIYFDADLATDISSVRELIKEIEMGYDVSIGSRLLPKSNVERLFAREIASRGYNLLARFLFHTEIKDLQCGLKAFRRSTLPILLSANDNYWFWDSEILIMAEKENLKISEIPVKWNEGNKSKVNILKDSIVMGLKLLRLKIKLI